MDIARSEEKLIPVSDHVALYRYRPTSPDSWNRWYFIIQIPLFRHIWWTRFCTLYLGVIYLRKSVFRNIWVWLSAVWLLYYSFLFYNQTAVCEICNMTTIICIFRHTITFQQNGTNLKWSSSEQGEIYIYMSVLRSTLALGRFNCKWLSILIIERSSALRSLTWERHTRYL